MSHARPHLDDDEMCYCTCPECREHSDPYGPCICPDCIHAG